jgi:hypothetical protein
MSTAALKIKVTIAQPFVIAGTPFSLTTTVENAHEESIEVLEYLYHIPYQVRWIHDDNYHIAFNARREAPWYRRPFQGSPWKRAAQPPGQVMYYANLKNPDEALVSVLPSESTSYSFKALVSKWLFVSGGELVFPARIKYRYKQAIHFAPFEVRFTLRPPIVANGIGAVLGALLGSGARALKDDGSTILQQTGLEFAAATLLACILAAVAVVYSSRRTGDSQPILTVEDFWGGLIVGFMVGYLGSNFFQQVVPIAKGGGA